MIRTGYLIELTFDVRNGVSRLDDDNFSLLVNRHLSVLDLRHNSFVVIEDNVLVGINVTHLDLGYNQLRRPPNHQLQAGPVFVHPNPLSGIENISVGMMVAKKKENHFIILTQ